MKKIKENINNKTLCPICGKYTFNNTECKEEVCPYCGWIHNVKGEQAHNKAIFPNDLSLQDYQTRYDYYIKQNKDYIWDINKYPKLPQIKPMVCPICKKHYFKKLRLIDIYCDDVPPNLYCPICGWYYDLSQVEDPNKKDGTNEMSLNEYKNWYSQKLQENPNYNFFYEGSEKYIPTPHKCPVCGKYEFKDFGSYDICPHCGWEDDALMEEEPDKWEGCANDLCLNDFIKRYKSLVKKKKDYCWEKDGYMDKP